MKREREKTKRLAIIAITIIAVVSITANQASQGFINQSEQVVEYEPAETSETPWWGWLLAIGLCAFEGGTFCWMLKEEKKGYTFS